MIYFRYFAEHFEYPMRIIKSAFLLIGLFLVCNYSFGQAVLEGRDGEESYKHTFFGGGSLGVQFGTVTMVDISPMAGYYILEYWSAGLGLTYQYINDQFYHEKMNVIGGRLFSRFYFPFFPSVFAHGEYQYMTYQTNVYSANRLTNQWFGVSDVLLGGGFRQGLGGRSGMTLMILWNFNETPYSLYSNPVMRVGFDIGF
jgi:hypothetical protein